MGRSMKGTPFGWATCEFKLAAKDWYYLIQGLPATISGSGAAGKHAGYGSDDPARVFAASNLLIYNLISFLALVALF
jgi:hypothetical protein